MSPPSKARSPSNPLRRAAALSLLALLGSVAAGATIAHQTETPLYGGAVTLMLLSIGLRAWLGRLPPSLRLDSSVRRRGRSGPR